MRKWEMQDAQWYALGIVVMRERKYFRMRSDMAQGIMVMRQWMIQDAQDPQWTMCLLVLAKEQVKEGEGELFCV